SGRSSPRRSRSIARRPCPDQDRHRPRHLRNRPENLRQFHRAPGTLHRRWSVPGRLAPFRRERVPQGRARCRQEDGYWNSALALRKQNGRQQPWKVPYWGLGNEMDGPWQMGHRSAEDYGKFALEAAKLMKWTDPSIKLIAAGSSNFGPGSDWTAWNRTVLEYL